MDKALDMVEDDKFAKAMRIVLHDMGIDQNLWVDAIHTIRTALALVYGNPNMSRLGEWRTLDELRLDDTMMARYDPEQRPQLKEEEKRILRASRKALRKLFGKLAQPTRLDFWRRLQIQWNQELGAERNPKQLKLKAMIHTRIK
jgi:hypothetical protein